MAECSECGKESMSFTCRYCNKKFCSEHRLPEKHDCDGLEETVEEEKEEAQKWFKDEKVKNPAPSQKKEQRRRKPTITNEIRRTLKNNYVMAIIGLTSMIFVLQLVLGSSPTSTVFYDLFVLDPALSNILTQPWVLFTVLFIHAGLFHVFANMITLYFFGRAVENAVGGKEFLKLYFGAGIVSSLGYILFRNVLQLLHGEALNCAAQGVCNTALLSTMGPAVGASGAVVACFAVVAMLYPEAEVLLYFVFPMKIRTALNLFIGIEAINLASKLFGYSLPYIGGFASSAHLAGILVGLWYGKKLRDRVGSRRTMFEIAGR